MDCFFSFFTSLPFWAQITLGIIIFALFTRTSFPKRTPGQATSLYHPWSDPTWSYEIQKSKKNGLTQIRENLSSSTTTTTEETKEEDSKIISVDVLSVGGGAAGLALGAELEAKKITNYIIIEKNNKSGDVWRSRYHRLHLHDLILNEHLPHFPMPDIYPECPAREEFATYLDAYQKVLGIKIRYSSEVVQVLYLDEEKKRPQNLDAAYRWKIKVIDYSSKSFQFYYAKHLVLSHGLYGGPLIPSFPHSKEYTGAVYHSSEYTNATDLNLKDKKVLVVGLGNSGAEICLDLLEHGVAKVDCITRSPTTLVARDTLHNLAYFWVSFKIFFRVPFAWLLIGPIFLLSEIFLKLDNRWKWGYIEKHGVPLLWKGTLTRFITEMHPPLIDVGTMDCIVKGVIGYVKSPIVDLDPQGVVLKNGEKRNYDAIIYATGFQVMTGHNSIMESRIADKIGSGGKGFKLKNSNSNFGTQCPTVPGLWWQWGNLILIRIGAMRIATGLRNDLNPQVAKEENLKLKLKIGRFVLEHIFVGVVAYCCLYCGKK